MHITQLIKLSKEMNDHYFARMLRPDFQVCAFETFMSISGKTLYF